MLALFSQPVLRQLFITLLLLTSLGVYSQLLPNFGGQRAGLSALSFLKNDLSTQSFAMGSASIALQGNGFSSEVNPAALTSIEGSELAISNQVMGAGINQSYFGFAKNLANGGTLAFNVNSLNSGAMEVRTEFEPNGTGQLFYVNNTALGLNYAQKLSDRFSIGIGLRYVYEGIAEYVNHTVTGDIGFLYTTDFKDLTFAVVVKNFGGNSQMMGDYIASDYNRTTVSLDKYTTPTVFKMGFSLVPYKTEKRKLTVAAQLNHPNDNAENLRFGAEMDFNSLLFARLGYKLSVRGQNYPTLGLGYKGRIGGRPIYVDYGLNPTNWMGSQHIFGIRVPFINESR